MMRLAPIVLVAFFLFTACADSPPEEATKSEVPAPATEPAEKPAEPATADPCQVLTVDEVAAAFEVDVAAVSRDTGDAANSETAPSEDCVVTVMQDGIATTVSLFTQSRDENTPVGAWSGQVTDLLENGEPVGEEVYDYVPISLGDHEGALSAVHGGDLVRTRTVVWQVDEEHLYRLTVSSTKGADVEAELAVPEPELFTKLAAGV